MLSATVERARASARGITAAEVRSEIRAGLPQKDIAQLPSADDCVRGPVQIAPEALTPTDRQVVQHAGEPAVAASSVDIAEVEMAVVNIAGTCAAVFIGKAADLRPLVVGHVFGPGIRGVKH